MPTDPTSDDLSTSFNFCECGLARYLTEDGETFACPDCDGYEPGDATDV